ncbi:hypothetical protein H4218_005952 [Coemansia sp. IMI 209128]|nr:hypothetical protein H4218_005952 [Coemansia sp. IMI 209128]
MPSQHRPLCSNSSSSSASTNPRLGDHQSSIRASLRPNSIFYRPRRRSVTPPHSADESDPPTTPNDVEVDSAYEPEPESEAESASNVDEDCDNEALRLIRQWEAEEDRAAELYCHEVATSDLARTLPFGRCIVEPDTRGFMYSHALSPATRPTTIPEERKAIKYAQHNFLRPTGEIVNTTIEYLELLRTGNVPIVNIPIDRRLSCEYDFIWNLIDNTGTDMWVAITCVILLKRYCSYKNAKQNAPYGSRHALYLGILMVAATHVHLSDRLDKFSYENILSIIGSPFTKADLVRLKRETLVALDHKAWVGTEDIVRYAKNNQFDIAHIYSSEELYKTRERMRSILRERKLREKEERRALCANLERFMHRAPHDAGGSWNPETSHCIEPRFLFRHLPWFPGAVNPLHVSARSEEIVLYSRDRKTKPIFSPLLPPLKDRNLKAFFET